MIRWQVVVSLDDPFTPPILYAIEHGMYAAHVLRDDYALMGGWPYISAVVQQTEYMLREAQASL